MLNVYQIQMAREIIDYVNSNGRFAAQVKYPQFDVWSRLIFGAKEFLATDFIYFTKVATVDCDDIEDCFTIMNRWSPEDEAKVTRLNRLHSLSVGDIVEQDGKFFVCDNCGFREFYIPGFIKDQVK